MMSSHNINQEVLCMYNWCITGWSCEMQTVLVSSSVEAQPPYAEEDLSEVLKFQGLHEDWQPDLDLDLEAMK